VHAILLNMKKQSQRGFTTIELVLILVVIGILAALVITTRAGVQQKERNGERQRDIKELRDGLEGYFAQNNRYPTFSDMNSDTWRQANLKSIESGVFRDPSNTSNDLSDKPTKHRYAYTVTSASGTACDDDKTPCTQYTLTATLEGGGTYSKSNLN